MRIIVLGIINFFGGSKKVSSDSSQGKVVMKDEKDDIYEFVTSEDKNGNWKVFSDYPNSEEVLRLLKLQASKFLPTRKNNNRVYAGGREKFLLSLVVNGENQEFIVKKKYEGILGDSTFRHDPEHELVMNRIAASRYFRKFKQELLIEKPVGYVLGKSDELDNSSWVVFEKIPNVVDVLKINNILVSVYMEKIEDGEKKVIQEFEAIGIRNGSKNKQNLDIVLSAPQSIISGTCYVVDSEEWEDVRK